MEQMVQLCEAVAMVHEELLSSVVRDSPPDLDWIATGLATRLDIYGTRAGNGSPERLTDEDFARGIFRDGATRFEYRDGRPPLTQLMVRAPELLQLLDGLRPMFDRSRLEQRLA
jgi:hypothetical protein